MLRAASVLVLVGSAAVAGSAAGRAGNEHVRVLLLEERVEELEKAIARMRDEYSICHESGVQAFELLQGELDATEVWIRQLHPNSVVAVSPPDDFSFNQRLLRTIISTGINCADVASSGPVPLRRRPDAGPRDR